MVAVGQPPGELAGCLRPLDILGIADADRSYSLPARGRHCLSSHLVATACAIFLRASGLGNGGLRGVVVAAAAVMVPSLRTCSLSCQHALCCSSLS